MKLAYNPGFSSNSANKSEIETRIWVPGTSNAPESTSIKPVRPAM